MRELRNKNVLSILLTVLIVVLIGLCMCTPPSRYSIVKTVVNADKELMQSVTVELWKSGSKIDEKITNKQGRVKFKDLPVGTYTIKLPDFGLEETVFLNEDKEIENKVTEKGG